MKQTQQARGKLYEAKTSRPRGGDGEHSIFQACASPRWSWMNTTSRMGCRRVGNMQESHLSNHHLELSTWQTIITNLGGEDEVSMGYSTNQRCATSGPLTLRYSAAPLVDASSRSSSARIASGGVTWPINVEGLTMLRTIEFLTGVQSRWPYGTMCPLLANAGGTSCTIA